MQLELDIVHDVILVNLFIIQPLEHLIRWLDMRIVLPQLLVGVDEDLEHLEELSDDR